MSTNLTQYDNYVGQVVQREFSPGFVILSYVVSYIGAWTTLELINKRTAGKGIYNWTLLIGSSISMGGIAIWCMHFIGNRAVVLADGDDKLQISYNSGFTALSFFVPILVLLAAFLAVGSNDEVSIVRVTFGGAVAGMGICGMHYLGQTGISNYHLIYQAGNVVGSVFIAIAASITALYVFFVLRSTWTNFWWKRALTAIVLAGGVSGMHWLATMGTEYRLRELDLAQTENFSRSSTVVVVIVLSISACFVLLGITLVAQRRRAQSANRAQQVVLASAIFDKDGRLMVTPEGLLPNTKITNTYVERSFDDVFGISHPVYLWIFRTSRNWASISDLLPAMRSHLSQVIATKGARPGTKSAELALTNDAGELIEDYSIIFRELFCVAAAELADKFNEPIENSGVLYDEILSTGQMPRRGRSRKSTPTSSMDLERDGMNLPIMGRGQLLFLVRSVSSHEAEHLQAAGFRFAAVSNIVDIVARSMQIDAEDLSRRIVNMRQYATKPQIMDPGVHVACFAIRASIRGGFDVLVRKDARSQLPTMQMPLEELDNWQLEYLRTMSSWSFSSVSKHLKGRISDSTIAQKEYMFALQLHDTMEALIDEIDDSFINDALLISSPIDVPCRGATSKDRPKTAQLISFHIIVPIHNRSPSMKLEFSPLPFFKMHQHVYPQSQDHEVFKRLVHREFGPILQKVQATVINFPASASSPSHPKRMHISYHQDISSGSARQDGQEPSHGPPNPILYLHSRQGKSRSPFWIWKRKPNNKVNESKFEALEDELTLEQQSSGASTEKKLTRTQTFGGILVSQEVSVDVGEAEKHSATDGKEVAEDNETKVVDVRRIGEYGIDRIARMGTMGVASKEAEPPTFVDQLFAICIESR